MKFIKYIAIMLLAGLALSCGESAGTVGQTTIGFADTEYEDFFAAGRIYVPVALAIEGDVEANANTADVQAKIRVIDTDNCTENVDGITGEFMITSYDVVFRPGFTEALIEIYVNNPANVPSYNFTLELYDANTAMDAARSQCVVTVKQDARDAFAGEWVMTADDIVWPFSSGAAGSYFVQNMVYNMAWDNSYGSFILMSKVGYGYPMFFDYDFETEELSMPVLEVIGSFGTLEQQGLVGAFPGTSANDLMYLTIRPLVASTQAVLTEPVVMSVDMESKVKTIKFPTNDYMICYCIDIFDSTGTTHKLFMQPNGEFAINPVWTKK